MALCRGHVSGDETESGFFFVNGNDVESGEGGGGPRPERGKFDPQKIIYMKKKKKKKSN